MWWRGQNLEKPVHDGAGRSWHFRVWSGFKGDQMVQRIYFWNTDRSHTGLFEVVGDQTVHVRKIKQRIA
jgi:hypothetical protein